MNNPETLYHAENIAKRFNDLKGIAFYYKAVSDLGLYKCEKLVALVIDANHIINKAAYFNKLVTQDASWKGKK